MRRQAEYPTAGVGGVSKSFISAGASVLRVLAVIFSLLLLFTPTAQAAFEDNGDGTVINTATGLVWQQAQSPTRLTWEEALQYATSITDLGGCSDWRVPNRKELKSLVDRNQTNPAIDTSLFLGTVSEVYWTSSKKRSSTDVWGIDFARGTSALAPYNESHYVRVVSSGCSLDYTAPELISIDPAGDAVDVPVNSVITATFSENIDSNSVNGTSFNLGATVSGGLTVNGAQIIFTPSAQLEPSTTYTATLSGTITDMVGNALGSDYQWSFTTVAPPESEPPTGSIIIESGEIWTNSLTVALGLSATDNSGTVTEMRFSQDNLNWDDWVPYATSASLDLSAPDGNKAVYVQFRDLAGNISTSYSDNILLDTLPPTLTLTQIATPTDQFSQTIGGFVDSGSIVSLSIDTTANATTPVVSGTSWTSDLSGLVDMTTNNLTITATDPAGNKAELVSAIVVDTSDYTPPTGNISINGGSGYTNDTAVTLVLSASDEGGLVETMRLSSNGSDWNVPIAYATSAAWTLPAGDGSKSVYVEYFDAAGNKSETYSASIILDTVAPVLTVVQPISPSGEAGLSLQGTLEDLASLDITADTGANVGSVVNPDGHWSCAISNLSSGNNSFTLLATDPAGNSSQQTVAVYYDNHPPTGTITIAGGELLTNSATVELSLSADDDLQVSGMRFANSGTVWSAWEDFSTSKTWQLIDGSGSKMVLVQYRDQFGNISSEFSDSIQLDMIVPELIVNNQDTVAASDSLIASGTMEEGATLNVSADNTTVVIGDVDNPTPTIWDVPISNLPEGTTTVVFSLTDLAGNTASSERQFTYDSVAPTGSILINYGAGVTNSQTVTLSLSADDASSKVEKMQLRNSVGSPSDWLDFAATSSWALPDEDGEQQVYVRYQDSAGNVSAEVSAAITLDRTEPLVSIDPLAETVTSNRTLLLTGGREAGANVSVSIPGGNVVSVGTPTDTSWTASLNLVEGTNNITVTASDNAGNSATASTSLVLDTTVSLSISAPQTPTNSSTQTLAGTCEAGAEVVVVVQGGVTVGTVGYPTPSSWQVVLSDLQVGANLINVTAKDALNNFATRNASIVVDITAPTGSLVIGGDADSTSQQTVLLKVSASDNVGPVSRMRFKNATGSWSDWTAYKSYRYWNLTSEELEQTVFVELEDAAGNLSSEPISDSIILDTTQPTVTINGVSSPTQIATQLIGGSMEPGSTVVVNAPAGVVGDVTYPGSYSWQATVSLDEGLNTISVLATDGAGNKGSASAEILLDTVAEVSINPVVTPSNKTGLLLSGSREANAEIALQASTAVSFGDIAYPTSTSWTCQVDGLQEGSNRFTASATDSYGNSGSAIATVVIDSVAPTGTLVINNYQLQTNSVFVNLQLMTNDNLGPVEWMRFSNDGVSWSAWKAYQGSAQWALVQGDGEKTVYAQVRDAAGNVSDDSIPINDTIRLDTVGPLLTLNALPAATASEDQLLSGTTEDGASVTVDSLQALEGVVTVSGTVWNCPLTLAVGTNSITVSASDAAGNRTTRQVIVELDKTSYVQISPLASPTNKTSLTVSGVREMAAAVTVSTDTGATVGTVNYPTATSWQVELTGLAAGDNVITAEATDGFGNSGSTSRTVVVDLVPPTVLLDSYVELSNQPIRTLSGTREPGDTIFITSETATLLGINYSGTSWQASVSLLEGDNSIRVKATDIAGNSSYQLLQMTLDSIAEVTIDNYSAHTNQAGLTIGGYLEPDSDLQLQVDSDAVLGVPSINGDRWTCTIALANGPNIVTATATDSLDNTDSVTRVLNLDTDAPKLTVNALSSPSNDSIQTLTGTVEASAEVVVSAPGAVVFPVSVVDDQWQATLDLPDGVTDITVTAIDASGNQSSVETSVEVDTVVLFTVASSSLYVNSPDQLLTGVVEADYSSFDYSIDSTGIFGELQTTNDSWQLPVTLAEGENLITLDVVDVLGNHKQLDREFVLDTQAPDISIDPLANLTTENLLTISGSISAGDSISLSSSVASVLSLTTSETRWEARVSLAQGINRFMVTAYDAAGNVSHASASIILDDQAMLTFDPLAWSQSPSSVGQQVVVGTVELGATLSLDVTGGSAGPVQVDGSAWSCEVTLSPGLNTITVTAKDSNDNTDSITRTVFYDNQPPAAVSLAASNTYMGGEISLDWSLYDSAGEEVEQLLVYASDQPISSLSGLYPVRKLEPDQTGAVLTGLDDNRSWYFTVIASDAAGNLSAISEVSAVPTLQGFQGFVTDSQSEDPLVGAVVDIAGVVVTTNETGYYRLAGLAAGEYDLTISGGGYQAASFTAMAVVDGAMARIDAALVEQVVEPSVPQNMVAEAADQLVTISWDAVSDADLVGYNLYRLLSPNDSSPQQLNTQPIIGVSFVDMDLANGELYYYLVRSINQAGTLSSSSELVSAMPQPAAPEPAEGLAAILNPDNSVSLLWSKSPTAGVDSYNIYSDGASGVINYDSALASVGAWETNWKTDPLAEEVTYYFGLRAVKDGIEDSNQTLVVSVWTTTAPISAPRAVLSEPQSGERLTGNRITLQAELSRGQESDVENVLFQYRPVDQAAWRDVPAANVSQPNPDSEGPYLVRWDVSNLKGGYFELRALATAAADGSVDPAPQSVIVAIDHKKPSKREWKDEKVVHALKTDVKRGSSTHIELSELSAGEKFVVDVPEGSLTSNTQILAEVPNADEFTDTLSGLNSSDRFLRLRLDSGQEQFANGKLIDISIPYPDVDNDGIVDGTNISEASLQLLWLNRETGRWEHSGIENVVIDVIDNVISGQTSHFTDFGALGGEPLAVSIDSPSTPVNVTNPVVSGSVSAGATVELALTGTGTVGTVTYPTPTTWRCQLAGLGEGTVSLTAIADSQGVTETASATVTVDLRAPVGAISVNAGAATTSSDFVTLSLTYSDVGSGVESMTFRNEGGAWSAPVSVASTWSWSLSPGTGSKTISVQYTDAAGNDSPIYSDSIELTAVPPASVQPGSPVVVNPDPDVTLTFDQVTGSGDITVSSAGGLTAPDGYEELSYASKEIDVTAKYAGEVEVCIGYHESDLRYPKNEAMLKLMHDGGSGWTDITTLVDPSANVVCGRTSSFSPFMIVETPGEVGTVPQRVPVMQGWWVICAALFGCCVFVRRHNV